MEIFSLIIAGYNASEVARILNERKIPTRVQNSGRMESIMFRFIIKGIICGIIQKL